jgi:hypothetical protein
MNPEQSRTVVIGSVKETKPNMVQVTFTNASGNEQTAWIPTACIDDTQVIDDETIHFLKDGEMNGVAIKVANMYTFSTDHAQIRDIADAWIEFGEVTPYSLDAVVQKNEGEEVEDIVFDLSGGAGQTFNLSGEAGQTFNLSGDDSQPVQPIAGKETSVDLAAFAYAKVDEEDATKQAKRKQSAIEKAAMAREMRKADSDVIKESLNDEISKAMADGKRHEDFGAWNFEAKTYELAMVDYDLNGDKTYIPVRNANGDARVRCVVNPTLADDDNPLGFVLNRAVGANFEVIDHPTIFKPVIQAINGVNDAAGKEVISWSAFSINKGSRAVMNVDITGYATETRKQSAGGLSNFGYVNLSANRISDMLVEEQGGHRMGVTIMNAHDGKSALQAFMTVLRTYCGNLAMRGGVQNLLMAGNSTKVRHMKGSVAEFDPVGWADNLVGALAEAERNLVAMSILRHIPSEMLAFDSMLTVMNKHGLLPQPSVKIAAADKTQLAVDEKGNSVIESAAMLGKDAVKILGGHAYHAVLQGWMNPDVDYVSATKKSGATQQDEDSVGTMWHLAQCGSGVVTHNPIYSDGKRTLHGKTQGVETMMKRSTSMTEMFESIAFNAVNKYAEHTGAPVDDLEAMGQWYADNPHELEVPYSNTTSGAKTMTSLTDIPAFHSTWKVKVVTEVAPANS